MAQTDPNSYGYALDAAQTGQLYDIRPNTVESYAAEGDIDFGLPVVAGTDPEKQVTVGTGTFRGISLFEHTRTQRFPASGGAQYIDTDPVSVLRKGAVWVTAGADVDVDDEAYFTDAGEWTNVATDNNATGGTFRKTATSGGLTIVEIDLP